MRTVAETPVFIRYASEVWAEDERQAFISFIAANPEAGDLIRGSGGCRKVRWSRSGAGKRGGVRVIYFLADDATVWLLIVYTKARFDTLPTAFLEQLKKGIHDALRDGEVPERPA
jgi:mRNA-degrading endonuclease RelE of RelBE toxin-antitoxin system